MSSTKRFSLPRKKSLKTIDISNCQSIKRIKDVPEGMMEYNGYYQANQCEAKLDKAKIKKSENNAQVEEARIFCDQLQSPLVSTKTKRKSRQQMIKQYGKSKGEYYFNHDTFFYEGRKDSVCEVGFRIKDPEENIIHTSYKSSKIFLSKPHK